MANTVRQTLRRMVAAAPLRLLPLDGMLRLSQRVASGIASLVFVRDWQLEARGRPQFFKHQLNLARWNSRPANWAFTARGVRARELMWKGCRVLDLCCGDGSYSYLFFSDIAGHVDAVDADAYAIEYARRQYRSPVVSFHEIDIVTSDLPGKGYDVAVWNAAICYFTEADIHRVIARIIAAGAPAIRLAGMLPRANGWIDHKTEFADCESLARLLRQHFADVVVREVEEAAVINLYFVASAPLPDSRNNA